MIQRVVPRSIILLVVLCVAVGEVVAQPGSPPPEIGAETIYAVSSVGFEARFANLPDLDRLRDVPIVLGRAAEHYGAPTAGARVDVTLESLFGDGAVGLSPAALDIISQTLADAYFANSGIAVFICPRPEDIDPATGVDLRPAGTNALTMLVVFDGPRYDVNAFVVTYATAGGDDRPDLALITEELQVELYRDGEEYVAWRPGVEPVTRSLASFEGIRVTRFSAGAVQSILETISRAFMDLQIMGTYVRPGPDEFAPDLADLRGDRTSLNILVYTSTVSAIRTLASGDRIPPRDRVDHPAHARLRTLSPFQPPSETAAGESVGGELLRKDELDEYLYMMSRHPGRRVDAAVAPGLEANTLSLDYLVTERKPWTLYYQGSNTGTAQTGRWRNRFGIFNNQLTGRDDILNIEYISPDFEDTNTLSALYSGRVGENDRLRWNVSGFWSEYVASEVGFANEQFTGESWGGTAEVAWNIRQDRQLFIDLVGGVRYLDVKVRNQVVNIEGEGNFAIPFIGARVERFTEEANSAALLSLEGSSASWTDVDKADLNSLGRLFPDEDFVVFKWDFAHSMFLE
ncbi:MAG: ShlB/FhaC/HecB family hemolysin secretion/activation protein, partial [Planctomycetota bacterium]